MISLILISSWLALLFSGWAFGGAVHLLLGAALVVFPWRAAGRVSNPPKALITPALFSQPPPRPPGEEGEQQAASTAPPGSAGVPPAS